VNQKRKFALGRLPGLPLLGVVLLLVLPGCTGSPAPLAEAPAAAVDPASSAVLVDDAASSASGAASGADDTPSEAGGSQTAAPSSQVTPTMVPVDPTEQLLDTASVLLPAAHVNQQQISALMEQFAAQVQEIDPVTLQVQQVSEVYAGPGQTYLGRDLLLPGTEVSVDGQLGHWFRIADGSGYVSALGLSALDGGTAGVWQVAVANSGGNEEVDACTGGLTSFTSVMRDLGKQFYAIHSYCGGEPVLGLQPGDVVRIDQIDHEVLEVVDAPLAGSTQNIRDLPGDMFLYSSDLAAGTARVVALRGAGG